MANVPKIISRDSLIYFAGFFDGEGCVNICERHPKHGGPGGVMPFFRAGISVSNTHLGVLHYLQSACGGTVHKSRNLLPKKNGDPRKPQWRWSASCRESIHILRQLAPYLFVKQRQALLAIEFSDSIQEFRNQKHPGRIGKLRVTETELERRRGYARRMQALNHPAIED